MKWISVKDDLPRKHEKVLITDGKTVCLHYKQSAWNFGGDEGNDLFPLSEGLKDSNGKWVSCCDIEEGEVTHWMSFAELLSYIQPDRSKREEVCNNCRPVYESTGKFITTMRCSEHCGNTVREVQ